MHRALSSRWLSRALQLGKALPASGVPMFLCPTLAAGRIVGAGSSGAFLPIQRRSNTMQVESTMPNNEDVNLVSKTERKLPITCTGCGSFTQTNDPSEFGYFDINAKRVRSWISPEERNANAAEAEGNKIVEDALKALDPEKLKELGLGAEIMMAGEGRTVGKFQGTHFMNLY